MTNNDTASLPILVGVDGSESSRRALSWAARQASLNGVPLIVLTVWTFPESPAPLDIPVKVPFQEELVKLAQARLDEIVAEDLSEAQRTTAQTKVVCGSALPVLLGEAEDASLLVLGRRSQHHVLNVLMGSVADRCLRHANCPVVIVP